MVLGHANGLRYGIIELPQLRSVQRNEANNTCLPLIIYYIMMSLM